MLAAAAAGAVVLVLVLVRNAPAPSRVEPTAPASVAAPWPSREQATPAPYVAACPAVDQVIGAETLRAMGGIAALECFGDATLTLEGTVRCARLTRDGGPGGPSWLDPYSGCAMDDALALYGPPVTALLDDGTPPPPNPVVGRYRVRGHFDDPEARTCSMLPIGVSVTSPIGPPDPEAVMLCRQAFVVTEVEALP